MLRLTRLACLVGAFALAVPTFAQTIDTATPTSAAVGMTLEIKGSGFGVAKPKVQLFDTATSKKYALKVVDNSDTVIHATITKAVEGDLQLQVIVKGAAAPANGPSNISIERPLVTNLSASSADPNAPLTVFGDYFGLKGTILINGQRAKIESWAMNEIHLLMPKKLPNGFFSIVVDNKLGHDDSATVQVTNSLEKIGKAGLIFSINGSPVKFKYAETVGAPNVIAGGASSGSNPLKALAIAIPYNVNTLSPPFTIHENDFAFAFAYIETPKFKLSDLGDPTKLPSAWAPQGGPGFTLTVNAESGGQISATFSGYLKKLYGAVGPDTYFVEGSIVVDV